MTLWLPERAQKKETNSDFIAWIRTAEHLNSKRYSIERELIWKSDF